MANPLKHAESSARLFGGNSQDYIDLHEFLDMSKLFIPDNRHRCLLHNNFGIALCERFFGFSYSRPSDQIHVCVRTIAEQHIKEDLGCIPTVEIMLHEMPIRSWMAGFDTAAMIRMQTVRIGEGSKKG